METVTIVELLLIPCAILYFIHQYFCANFNIFRNQGIPGPKPIPIFGTWWNSWRQNPHEIALNNFKKYGKVYGTFRGRKPVLHVQDLPMLRSILIKDSLEYFGQRNRRPVAGGSDTVNKTVSLLHGEQWRVLRSLMMRTFSPQLVKQRVDFANNSVQEFVEYCKVKVVEADGKMDLRVEAEMLCEELMLNYATGTRLGSIGNPNHPFVLNARRVMEAGERSYLRTMTELYPKLSQWLCPVLDTGNEYLVELSKTIIKERTINSSKNAHSPGSEKDMIDILCDCLNGNESKGSLCIDQTVAIAQTTSTILTGYDLGTVLTRVLHCLTVNPDVQRKCREEIGEKIGKYKEVTFDFLCDLPYLEQCIREALRLYPTVFANFRFCTKDKLYDNIFIPKGTAIEYPLYSIQRDPECYPDPLTYDPDRFSPEESAKRDPLLFMPFGQGPRGCFAQKYSIMVLKQCLVHLLSTFEFFSIAETVNPISFTSGPSGMLTARDMWVGFKCIH